MVIMRGYIIDISHGTFADATYIVLHIRDENGKKVDLIDRNVTPFFYSDPGEIEEITIEKTPRTYKITKVVPIEKNILGKKINLNKISINNAYGINLISEHLRKRNINTYETDISFVRRYLFQKLIVMFTYYEFKVKEEGNNYVVESFEQVSNGIMPDLRILKIKVNQEGDGDKEPINSLELNYNDQEKSLQWGQNVGGQLSEYDMLNELKKTISDYQPDMILSNESQVLNYRLNKYKIKIQHNITNTSLFYQRIGRYFPNIEEDLPLVLVEIMKLINVTCYDIINLFMTDCKWSYHVQSHILGIKLTKIAKNIYIT